MAEATKSVLFVDYDGIHRSLETGDAAAAERLAPRVRAWVAAIESGKLVARNSGGGRRRRILMRRCYADPSLLGGERSSFLSNGFQVIDCPPAEGDEQNAAAIHMVLDAVDALEHPAGYDEFILLSAETDLSPLLIRLKAHSRATAIYAAPATSDSYKALADATIDEQRLVSVILSDEPAPEEEATHPPAERSDVEALARKVAGATNVPLFAPRTFAELFRHLVDEIAENGYHFQTTAENVATRMAEAGRNVTRRQVVFVVKGLALKGHVFSTSDTPDRLAEVFREQVLYLTDNAGLELDKNERSVLASWIIGRVAAGSAAASEDVEIEAAPAVSDARTSVKSTPKSGGERPSRSSRKKQSKSSETAKTEAAVPPTAAQRGASSSPPTKPDAESTSAAAPVPRMTEEPEARSATAPVAMEKPTASPAKPAPSVRSPPPAIRPPHGAKPASPLSRPPGMRPAATSPMRTPPVSRPATRIPTAEADKEKVESSILAAIAQAVDVLVEDDDSKANGGAQSNGTRDTAAEGRATAPEKKAPPSEADETPEGEGDDIGDEIQRIIASYNRKRDRNG